MGALLTNNFVIATSIFAFTLSVFAGIDRTSSESARRDFTRYLRNTDFRTAYAEFPLVIRTIFRAIFGKRHLSIKCIAVSVIFSVISPIIIFTLYAFGKLTITDFVSVFEQQNPVAQNLLLIIAICYIAVFLLIDFLSLLKSRIIIDYLSRRKSSVLRTSLVVIFDFVLAFPIFVGGVLVAGAIGEFIFSVRFFLGCAPCSEHAFRYGGFLFYVAVTRFPAKFAELFPALWGGVFYPNAETTPLGLLFFSTLVPSAWLWLYVISFLLTRLIARSYPGIRFLVYLLDIDQHPFRSVGIVAAVLAASAYLLIALL